MSKTKEQGMKIHTVKASRPLSVLLCSACHFWLNVNYPEWGQCELLQDRIGIVLEDSDATEVRRVDTPKNFGCVLGEPKA